MSDNEIDDELLALAGDDSASEAEDEKPTTRISRSPTPAASRSPSPKQNYQHPTKGVAQRKNARSRSVEVDDAHATPKMSTPNSLGSGAMSESDSDAVADNTSHNQKDDNMYPIDGRFMSLKDKAEIMALPEARREQIISDRLEAIDSAQMNSKLRARLRAQNEDIVQAQSEDKKKRKSGAAGLEESPRKITKQKIQANERIENYKRQRERMQDRRKDNADRKTNTRRSTSHDSGSPAADDSEPDWDDAAPAAPPKPDEPVAKLVNFERDRLGRTNFALCCFTPGFEDAITGCFAKINIGPDRTTGQVQHRMAQIKGFTTGKPYVVEGIDGQPVYTDQYIVAVQGKSEKEWPFIACSDSGFADHDLARYKRAQEADNCQVPSFSFLLRKLEGIHALLAHKWTELEITQKIRRRADIQTKMINIRRNRLEMERDSAIAREDTTVATRIDRELLLVNKLDPTRLLNPSDLGHGAAAPRPGVAPPVKPLTQQERLAALNKANRKANAETIRKAQAAERRADMKAQAAIARGEAVADPFARVKTKAKIHHDASDSLKPTAIDDLFENSANEASRAATPVPPSAPAKKDATKIAAPVKIGRKKMRDDDFLGSIDLGIEIDI